MKRVYDNFRPFVKEKRSYLPPPPPLSSFFSLPSPHPSPKITMPYTLLLPCTVYIPSLYTVIKIQWRSTLKEKNKEERKKKGFAGKNTNIYANSYELYNNFAYTRIGPLRDGRIGIDFNRVSPECARVKGRGRGYSIRIENEIVRKVNCNRSNRS